MKASEIDTSDAILIHRITLQRHDGEPLTQVQLEKFNYYEYTDELRIVLRDVGPADCWITSSFRYGLPLIVNIYGSHGSIPFKFASFRAVISELSVILRCDDLRCITHEIRLKRIL